MWQPADCEEQHRSARHYAEDGLELHRTAAIIAAILYRRTRLITWRPRQIR